MLLRIAESAGSPIIRESAFPRAYPVRTGTRDVRLINGGGWGGGGVTVDEHS